MRPYTCVSLCGGRPVSLLGAATREDSGSSRFLQPSSVIGRRDPPSTASARRARSRKPLLGRIFPDAERAGGKASTPSEATGAPRSIECVQCVIDAAVEVVDCRCCAGAAHSVCRARERTSTPPLLGPKGSVAAAAVLQQRGALERRGVVPLRSWAAQIKMRARV